jgi:hypothetical protein
MFSGRSAKYSNQSASELFHQYARSQVSTIGHGSGVVVEVMAEQSHAGEGVLILRQESPQIRLMLSACLLRDPCIRTTTGSPQSTPLEARSSNRAECLIVIPPRRAFVDRRPIHETDPP